MREALRSLTARGRAFLAAGATAALCGFVLGEADLVAIGALLFLVPLASALWVSRSRHELEITRTLSTPQVEVGQPVTVHLDVANRGRRTERVLVEDQVPYAVGSRPRASIDPLATGAGVGFDYTLRSDVRGSFSIGPAHVRVAETFGMVDLHRRFRAVDTLVVTPKVETLPPIPLAGAHVGTGEHRPRSFLGGNAADVTVREYHLGDDLRRVHWRSTARTGNLMVRREERPWQARCTLLVDNRARAHRGRGAASSLEAAIRAAASVAIHLAGLGYQVRMVSATGENLGHGWHDGAAVVNTRGLLAGLAVMPAAPVPSLATDWVDETVTTTLFVAVLGAIDEDDHAFFSRIGRIGGSSYGLVLDVAQWGAADPVAPATHWLRTIGWKAAVVTPDAPLAAAWQELAR